MPPRDELVDIVSIFNKCSYCFVPMTLETGQPHSVTFDHVIPRIHGGKSEIAACFACNSRKSDKPLLLFLHEMYGDDVELIGAIFYRASTAISPAEQRLLGAQRYGRFRNLPMGPDNNFHPLEACPHDHPHSLRLTRKKVRKLRAGGNPNQGQLF